jgi:hypothetical protein
MSHSNTKHKPLLSCGCEVRLSLQVTKFFLCRQFSFSPAKSFLHVDRVHIFSFLPVSECSDVFETHFATPQNYSIRSAAETFGLDYAAPHTNQEFSDIYRAACSSKRSIIIEVCSNRAENVHQHRALRERIMALATAELCH